MNDELKALGGRAQASIDALKMDKASMQYRRIHIESMRRMKYVLDVSNGSTQGLIMRQILDAVGGECIFVGMDPYNPDMAEAIIYDENGSTIMHEQYEYCQIPKSQGGPGLFAEALVIILEELAAAKADSRHFGDFTG